MANASLSSCESENVALAMASHEANFNSQLEAEVDGKGTPVRALVLFVDSQLAIDPVNNPVYYARIEHVLAKCHFIRDRVLN